MYAHHQARSRIELTYRLGLLVLAIIATVIVAGALHARVTSPARVLGCQWERADTTPQAAPAGCR